MAFVQFFMVITAIFLGSISLTKISPSIYDKVKDEKVEFKIIDKEKSIFEAVCRYTTIKGSYPPNMTALISNGYFLADSNDNGFGGNFDFTIDSVKGEVTIFTHIPDAAARASYINNYKNTFIPVQGVGDLVNTTFPIPPAIYNASGEFMAGVPVQTTAPSLLTNAFWYDTSSGRAVLKINNGGVWQDVVSSITGTGGGGSGGGSNTLPTSVSIVDSVAALPTTGVNGDIKYVYNGLNNSVIQYTYYNGNWAVSGGANSNVVNNTQWSYTIQDIYTNGYNNLTVLASNVLYTTSGNAGSWYDYNSGRFAAGGQTQFGLENLKPVTIPETAKIIKVSAVGLNSYALLENGNLYAWGYNGYGQLGTGNATNQSVPVLVATNVVDIYRDETHGGYSVSADYIFIKESDGYVYATGYNGYGVFGNGTTSTAYSWVKLTNWGTNVKNVWAFGANYQWVVVEKTDGTIWFAGKNNYGQAGLGHASHVYTLTEITNQWRPDPSYSLKEVRGSVGYYDSGPNDYNTMYMVFDNGTDSIVKTCGNDTWGQIGNGAGGSTYIPYTVPTGPGLIKQFSVSGGSPATIRVLKTDGQLIAWGYNYYGQIGIGTSTNVPSPVTAATGVLEMFGDKWDMNTYSYCSTMFIKKDDGFLYATGYNGHGQVGNGYTGHSYTYQKVLLPTGTNIVKMARYDTTGSGAITVAVSDKNELFAWGYNNQYGVTNTTSNNILLPMKFKIQKP